MAVGLELDPTVRGHLPQMNRDGREGNLAGDEGCRGCSPGLRWGLGRRANGRGGSGGSPGTGGEAGGGSNPLPDLQRLRRQSGDKLGRLRGQCGWGSGRGGREEGGEARGVWIEAREGLLL